VERIWEGVRTFAIWLVQQCGDGLMRMFTSRNGSSGAEEMVNGCHCCRNRFKCGSMYGHCK
jgi:hypothetical protein